MSTLLIWNDEIQKLSDLIKENKKLPSMFDKFIVLGTELRISEYNKLRQLPIPDDKLELSTALSEKERYITICSRNVKRAEGIPRMYHFVRAQGYGGFCERAGD